MVRGAIRATVAACCVILAASIPGTSAPPAAGPAAPSAPAASAPAAATPAGPPPVAAAQASASPGPAPSRTPAPFGILQMNLCNSGMALSCFSHGKSVDEAVTKIHQYSPDAVTVQEICRSDLYTGDGLGKLPRAMADIYGSEQVSVNFVPARNTYTGSPYRCLNGEQYGIGLVYHGGDRDRHDGWYRNQDGSDEIRAWTCGTAVAGLLTACTTHLSTVPEVAMRQCRELISTLSAPWVMPRVVVAGDFNLRYAPGQPGNIGDCAPAAYLDKNDGLVQQVLFSRGTQWVTGRVEPMRWTDHPMLYQGFRL